MSSDQTFYDECKGESTLSITQHWILLVLWDVSTSSVVRCQTCRPIGFVMVFAELTKMGQWEDFG